MSIDFGAVVSASTLVNNALNVFKNARELAQDTSDPELNMKISEAYDALLSIKDRVLDLDDENRRLKAELAAKAAYVGPDPPHGYFYAATDETKQHPLCPTCYQSNPSRIGFLDNPQQWSRGIRRVCKLCSTSIYEVPMDSLPAVKVQIPRGEWR
jgi:hypothetical protein